MHCYKVEGGPKVSVTFLRYYTKTMFGDVLARITRAKDYTTRTITAKATKKVMAWEDDGSFPFCGVL